MQNSLSLLELFAILEERLDIHLSYEVDPEHREYERTTTTVVNALLAPVVSKYLNSASQKLHALGLDVPIQVLSSSGGLVDVLEAKSRPVAVIESGPAAGVVGAAQLARILKFERVISLDMGGTTAKAGCVVDYEPLVTPEMEIRGAVHMGRVVKGSGYPVRYPCVDLAEVSAGGGTIIWGDEAGGLRVGPISAGAQPGPACYDTGGTSPTITDANLVLGRLGKSLIGGELNLNLERANEALKRVAAVVGLDPLRVAADSLKLINFHMARAVDIVSLERGFDPRGFSLVAFGGAGPMHAAELAEQVGIDKVVIPRFPGLFSAFGMLTTDMKYNYVKGFLKLFDDLPMQSLEQEFEEISASAMNDLKSRGFDVSNAKLSRSLDLRYLGQGYELEVSVDSTLDEQDIARKFEALHESVYGYRHDQTKLELTALRLTLSIPIMKPKIGGLESGSRPDTSVKYRDVWFGEDWVHTPIYPPNHPAEHLSGPAIVEGYDSTTVIPPRWRSSMAGMGAMLLEKSET